MAEAYAVTNMPTRIARDRWLMGALVGFERVQGRLRAPPALPEAGWLGDLPSRVDKKGSSLFLGSDQVLRYAPIRFLDGTKLPVFYVVKKSRAHTPRVTLDDIVSPPILLDQVDASLDEFCAGL